VHLKLSLTGGTPVPGAASSGVSPPPTEVQGKRQF